MKLIALLLILTGCATTYQKKSFSGGYSDSRLGKDKFRVTFYANGYTSSDKVHDFFIRRCAEITTENNYDNFVVLNENADHSVQNVSFNSGNLNQTYGNNYSYTGNQQTYYVKKHERSGIIKLYKADSAPESSYDAKSILSNYKE